jgi:hypothetical protein
MPCPTCPASMGVGCLCGLCVPEVATTTADVAAALLLPLFADAERTHRRGAAGGTAGGARRDAGGAG